MPSLFSAVWRPHKEQAQEKAKTVARTISFRGDANNVKRSGTAATTATADSSLNHGHGHQLNRAEQKALRREQRAKESAGALNGHANGSGTPDSGSRAMSPTSSGGPHHGHLGHGPETHQGLPIVDRTARYGYLEHSGRGLHLGTFSCLHFLGWINTLCLGPIEALFFRNSFL